VVGEDDALLGLPHHGAVNRGLIWIIGRKSVLGMGAVTLVCLGDSERAESWAKRALLLDPESYSVIYNAACTYAVIGKPELAQNCLEYVFKHMPRARGWILKNARHDAQLASLRGRRDFQDLMQRLEAHAAVL